MSQVFDKKLNVRINHKYDTYENWKDSDVILGKGEIAVAEVSTDKTGLTPPAIGIKIGNGVDKFISLPWIQSTAGDVYSWAKETAPQELFKKVQNTTEYFYKDFVNEIQSLVRVTAKDSNTTYEFKYNEASDKYEITSIDITEDGEVRTPWAEIDLSKKANKVVVAEGADVVGNVVTLNAYGDIADSGQKISDYLKSADAETTYATITKVQDLEGSVSDNRETITDIQTVKIPSIEGRISKNEKDIATLFPTVDNEGNQTPGYIEEAIAKIVAGADEDFDTLKEIADWIISNKDGGAGELISRISNVESQTSNLNGAVGDLREEIGNENSGMKKDIADNTIAISTLDTKVGDANGGLVKDVADNTTAISTLKETVSNGSVAWNEAVQDVLVGDETSSDRKYTTKDESSKNVSINAIPLNILENVEGFTLLFDCGNATGFNS